MKTFALLAAGLLTAPSVFAAGASYVIDTIVEDTLKQHLPTIDANIGLLLSDADKQLTELKKLTDPSNGLTAQVTKTNQKLDSLLTRLGDPSSVQYSKGINAVKNDITTSATGLQRFSNNNGVIDGMSTSKNDMLNNLYNENGGGSFTPIGTTYKTDKGDTVKRGTSTNKDVPPTDYSLEAMTNDAVRDYYRVRDVSLSRRQDLQSVLSDAMDQLNKAQDFATVEKITAVIQALQSQLQACSDDINNAYNDTAVRGLQSYLLSSVKSKADGEPRMASMNDKLQAAMDAAKSHPTPPASPPSNADYTSSNSSDTGTYLPWVRYSSK